MPLGGGSAIDVFSGSYAVDVATAPDQGRSALGCGNNPLIVPLNRK